MSNSSQSGGDGGDDNLWWTLLKVALIVIGAIVVLRVVFNIIWALMPVIVIAGLAYLAYRIFLSSDSNTDLETQDPMLLEHDTSDIILDEDELVEQKFRDLEASESRRKS